jgi:hypothetical protein
MEYVDSVFLLGRQEGRQKTKKTPKGKEDAEEGVDEDAGDDKKPKKSICDKKTEKPKSKKRRVDDESE